MSGAGGAVVPCSPAETRGAVRRDAAFVNVFAVVVALAGAAVSGRTVAAPLSAVGVLAVFAAVVDARTRRIPNWIPFTIVLWLAVGIELVITVDHRSAGEVAGSVLGGWLLSGTPLLAVIWLVRPSIVGGGDVKLLSVLGCTLGLLAPYAACVLILVAIIVALGQSVAARGSHVVLGPGFAVGYAVAVVVGAAANEVLGGRYL